VDNTLVVLRLKKNPKPSQRLLKSKEYLAREKLESRVPDVFIVIMEKVVVQ